jgi:hypothetical protein
MSGIKKMTKNDTESQEIAINAIDSKILLIVEYH